MNALIQICDVVGAISIIIALNMVARNYKWWLFYACTNVIFSVVTIYKGLPGFTAMGFILSLTGVKNYFDGRWKVNINHLVCQFLKEFLERWKIKIRNYVGRKKERSNETNNSIS